MPMAMDAEGEMMPEDYQGNMVYGGQQYSDGY